VTYTLERPASEDDWRAFHDIREAVLFLGRHREIAYNRNHPDDHLPVNQPLLLKLDGVPVGTLRLDNFGNGTGCLRLVAIAAGEQGRGHGRMLSELCEAKARAAGLHTLFVNSAPEAVGYYEKMGWERFVWDSSELVGLAADCVQMVKRLQAPT
jgi:N-acetylglutamate synthase-like GNAT family acetyltransferase